MICKLKCEHTENYIDNCSNLEILKEKMCIKDTDIKYLSTLKQTLYLFPSATKLAKLVSILTDLDNSIGGKNRKLRRMFED